MNYEGWMASLYDLYREEYNNYYQIKREKFLKRLKDSYKKDKIRGIIKEFLTFPNKLAMMGFIIYCFAEIVALVIYLTSIKEDNSTKMLISIVFMIIPPIILISTTKFTIEGYEKCVIVFKSVLAKKGIGTTEKINTLIQDSEKYLNKKKKVNYLIQTVQLSIPIIVAIMGADKYGTALNSFIVDNIEVLSIIIAVAILGIGIYLMITNRPEGKKQKIKELNYLLKVTAFYM